MSSLSASLSGTLVVGPPSTGTVEQNRSSGCSFGIGLRGTSASPANEISQQCVTTVAGFQNLPFPSNLRGRVLYLRMTDDSRDPIQVRITQEATGATTIANVLGVLLMEFEASDRLTLVEVSGAAKFEWACFGDNA